MEVRSGVVRDCLQGLPWSYKPTELSCRCAEFMILNVHTDVIDYYLFTFTFSSLLFYCSQFCRISRKHFGLRQSFVSPESSFSTPQPSTFSIELLFKLLFCWKKKQLNKKENHQTVAATKNSD